MYLIPNQTKCGWIKGSNFHNRSIKSWLQDNIEIYSTNNGEKSVADERFIRTWKNNIYIKEFNIKKPVHMRLSGHS